MKVTWEAGDIEPGLIVGVHGREECWMVGYDVDQPNDNGDGPRWLLFSLCDGMKAIGPVKRDEIAAHLNASGELPLEALREKVRAGFRVGRS